MTHPAPPTIKHLAASHRKIILLIDANNTRRELRASSLRARGVTVECESSASSGWSRYASGSYDLVLLDLGDDRAGALTLAEQMRTKKAGQKVAFFVDGPDLISYTQADELPQLRVVEPKKKPAIVPPSEKKENFGEQVRRLEAERDQLADPTHLNGGSQS